MNYSKELLDMILRQVKAKRIVFLQAEIMLKNEKEQFVGKTMYETPNKSKTLGTEDNELSSLVVTEILLPVKRKLVKKQKSGRDLFNEFQNRIIVMDITLSCTKSFLKWVMDDEWNFVLGLKINFTKIRNFSITYYEFA